MKKTIFKRLIMLILSASTIFIISNSTTYAKTKLQTDLEALKISVPEEYVPRYMSDVQTYIKYNYNGNKLNYKTSLKQVLARNTINPNLNFFAYWVQTSPQQYKTGGFLGFFGEGYNWHAERVESKIIFPKKYGFTNILSWAPETKASGIKGSIGVGVDTTGSQITASVDFNHSILKVKSLTNAGEQIFGTKYTFIDPWSGGNGYNRGTINSIGFVTFEKEGSVWIEASHEIEYWNSLSGVYKNNQRFVNFYNAYWWVFLKLKKLKKTTEIITYLIK